jgi:hypothetical protein
VRSIFSLVFCIAIFAVELIAGEWHVAGSLRCGDCHLQHSSEKGEPHPEGTQAYLLRKASVNEVCLSCHDGTDPTAPDVQAPAPMYASTVSQESAAGVLLGAPEDNPRGHTLGLPVITALQSTASPMILSCASCHAVHGNDNYRNLQHDPAALGADIRVALDTHVFVNLHPDKPPTPGGSINAYSRDNVAYARGMSDWCTSCHDLLATNSPAAAPAHFNNHPSNLAISVTGFDDHADAAHWIAGSGEGFTGIGGMLRVPFQVPTASSFTSAREVASSNQVTCLSCHKSHGSANQKALHWPYLEGGDNFLSGCQQCHNQ